MGRIPIHGEASNGRETHMYRLWSRIKERCHNRNKDNFHRYGGRGISVCEEWSNDFLAFKAWALKNGYDENLQIDRIDSNGDYEPSNCRFVSAAENTWNRDAVKLTPRKVLVIRRLIQKTKLKHKEIAELFGIQRTLVSMINTGKRWAEVTENDWSKRL
jgi:hypothetical protein